MKIFIIFRLVTGYANAVKIIFLWNAHANFLLQYISVCEMGSIIIILANNRDIITCSEI